MRILSVLVGLALLSPVPLSAADTFDVVVYGGTSAGIAAAVQTARMGASTIVIEPSRHVGGLTSGGLGWTDSGDKRVIGGISREFYQRVKRHYDQPSAWRFEKAADYDRYRPQDDAMWTFEPHVAEQVFRQMLAEHDITALQDQRLNRESGVSITDHRIRSITLEGGRVIQGRMFIDATYEGDLMAAAGVSYAVGRESNDTYDENLNGVQKRQNTHNHRFIKNVDPYVVRGDSSSGLLPGVHGDLPGDEGLGDRHVQAYCYRMCMSNVARNRVPFPKPDGHDELRYELLLRNFEAGDLRFPMKPDMMPNGKTDTNNNCAFSTDNLGMNYDYPEATYADRQKILDEHERYQQGLMWTLANHPRVPESIRERMSKWGLAADEFTDNGNWPHQIYVREARRMVGDYVMTEHDCRRTRVADDSVGLGSYNMDSHNVQRYVTPDGFVQNEGDVQVSPGGAYLISYRSIIPKRGEAENLLVPVCLSSSHIAYGSIRMEPVFMVLGQSAATAAVQANAAGSSVQDVDYAALRKRLVADRQVLDLPPNLKPHVLIASSRLEGIVIDDSDAELDGGWQTSRSVAPFVDNGYRHDNQGESGPLTARFAATLPSSGKFEVRVAYAPHGNRARNVPVVIRHAMGTSRATIDQTKVPPIKKLFISMGEFQFDRLQEAVVEISNNGADGYVIVDAVQFLPR